MMMIGRLAWLIVLVWLCTGCGKSQDDLRKYALRNTSGDDDDEPATPRATSKPLDSTASPLPTASMPTAPGKPPTTAAKTIPSSNVESASSNSNSPPVTIDSNSSAEQTSPPSIARSPGAADLRQGSLADTRTFSPSVTIAERHAQTIGNMQRIMEAMEAHYAEKGLYPAPFVAGGDGRPLLSWRVALLPYLGYGDLHKAFHLDEPWDSPHNRPLIDHVPSVYQSPERCDTRTNYVVPISTSGAFFGGQGKSPRRWEDGRENTILLIECDDDTSVIWTAPLDWQLDPRQPRQHVGALRTIGFLAGWGGGQIRLVPNDVNDTDLRGLFTVDGGESLSASAIGRDPASLANSEQRSPAASGASNQASPSSGSLTGSPAELGTAVETTSGGTETLRTQSIAAAEVGHIHDALACLYAHSLCDPDAEPLQYFWINGLRRPTATLRFGIGIDYHGHRSETLARQLMSSEPPTAAANYYSVIGDLGPPIVHACESHPQYLPAIILNATGGATTRTTNPSLQWLGLAKTEVLLRVAQKRFTDLLIVFEVDEKRGRNGREQKHARYVVRDVATGKALLTSERIDYQQREQARIDPLFEDPIDKTTRAWEALLTKSFVSRPLNGRPRKDYLQKRVLELTKRPHATPLPALCELQFYRRSEWLTVSELLSAFQTILGSNEGSVLLAGTPGERRQLANPWIPRASIFATKSNPLAVTVPDSDE